MKFEENSDFAKIAGQFPNIAKKLRLFWGNPELVTLMYELQNDNSDRPRAGFPFSVLSALQSLETLHDLEFPHLKREIPSFWQTLR